MNISKRLGIIVIVLIIIAIILILIAPSLSNTYTYTSPSGEKFTFTKSSVGDLTLHTLTTYVTYKNDEQNYQYFIPLRYGPKSLEDIYVQKGINDLILNKEYLYLTLDPNYNSEALLATIDIAKVTGTAEYSIFKIPTQGALIYPANNTNSTITPIITCNNANGKIGVIWLNIDDENKIYANKECVVVEGTDYDNLIKVADRLVYNLLGVM